MRTLCPVVFAVMDRFRSPHAPAAGGKAQSVRPRAAAIVPLLVLTTLACWPALAAAQTPAPPTAPATDELSPAKLLERLRGLEQTVDQLRAQNRELANQYQAIKGELQKARSPATAAPATVAPATAAPATAPRTDPALPTTLLPLPGASQPRERLIQREGGFSTELDDSIGEAFGAFGPPASNAAPDPEGRLIQREGGFTHEFDEQGAGNRELGFMPMNVYYNYGKNGVNFQTKDGELLLKFRFLTQSDVRYFSPAGDSPITDGFYFPRARLYFDGHVTKPIEYQLSFQQAYENYNILNAFFNLNYDKRLQLRFGRFKTPYTYEFYKINIFDLFTPERSLYNVNFGLNRQIGATASGEVFGDRLEYAIGAFNGQRNSFQPFKNTPDVIGLLNFTPFVHAGANSPFRFLKNLNVGGSGDYGYENNPLIPAVLRVSANATGTPLNSTTPLNSASVPFLAFNNNVRERGERALWELHMAYFYKGLSLLGAWDAGFQSWAMGASGPRPVRVPVGGYFVQAAYLITGETRSETGQIDPIRPFDPRPGRFGWGAIEPTARFSDLSVGKQVFTSGLADANLWTNQAYLLDVGVNWYLNRYVKVYLDWEYAMFGQPVAYGPDQFSKTNSSVWMRFQVYY